MRCPKCQTENPERSLACKRCGADLAPAAAAGAPTRGRRTGPQPAHRSPSDAERAHTLLDEAFHLADEGKLAQAITACQRAVAANPESTSAHSLLGILYERAGQRERAIQAYEAALRLSPDSAADRESLQQLVSPPPPPVIEVPVAPPVAPPPAPPRPAVRRRRKPAPATAGKPRRLAPMWYAIVIAAAVLALLLVLTVRAWRAASVQPAPTVPTPSVAAAEPRPIPPAIPPAPSARVPSPPPARAPAPLRSGFAPAGAGFSAPPAPPRAPAAPAASTFIPAPESFVRRAHPLRPAQPPAPTSEQARAQYFRGDLAGAVNTYQRLITGATPAGAETYQEAGWLYYQVGRRTDAVAAYQESVERYRRRITAGEDAEAARHGLRTAAAALRVLELE
ncbi:MAG TPA: tetratricopeptide repeat protein [Armatimonadota bacterium]|nr:tetratricopeptide repeat protein [Armatimonadota bacterium]